MLHALAQMSKGHDMIKATQANWEQVVKASNEKVLVDVYTDSCNPCKMMEPVLAEFEAETGVKVVKVDGMVETDIAKELGVRAVPALFLFEAGMIIASHVGTLTKQGLKEMAGC